MSFSVVCLKFSDTAVRYSRQLSIVSMLLTADSITSSFFKRSIGFLPAFLPSLLSYLARLSSLCLLQLFLRRSRRFFEIYSCRRADEAESSQELVDIMFLLFHNSSVMNINSAICCYGDLGYSKKLRMVLLSFAFRHFLTADRKKTFWRIFSYNFGYKKKKNKSFEWYSSLEFILKNSKHRGVGLKLKSVGFLYMTRDFHFFFLLILVFVNRKCCLCKCFIELYFCL